MVCGAIGAVVLNGPALAQSASLHPEVGNKPPLDILNRDVLALPERERQAWVNGAINGAFMTLHGHEPNLAQCMLAYYREADGHDVLDYVMGQRPEYPAASAVVAVANQVCDGLIPQS